jgi:hypothetical protein
VKDFLSSFFFLFTLACPFLLDLAEINKDILTYLQIHIVIAFQRYSKTQDISNILIQECSIKEDAFKRYQWDEVSMSCYVEIFRQWVARTTIRNALVPYRDNLAASFWCLVRSDESSFQTVLVNEMLPSLIEVVNSAVFTSQMLQTCWKMIQELMEIFFPQSVVSRILDLREDERFFQYIQAGLLHADNITRKRASICFQRAVHLSMSYPDLKRSWTRLERKPCSSLDNSCINMLPFSLFIYRYFRWSETESAHMSQYWDVFFVLYNAFDETAIHMIKPLWPKWLQFHEAEWIDFSWAQTLLMRLLTHENPHVKKFVFESILDSQGRTLQSFAEHSTFITSK